MKKLILLPFLLILFFLPSSGQSNDPNITPELSKKVIENIRKKYMPMYKQYKGIESNRQVEIKTYDRKTNNLLHTAHVNSLRKDYFYEEADIKILKYELDGEVLDPSKYKPLKYPPGYQVFDENGDKNYTTRVIGYKTVAGQHCYEVDVIPKEMTDLHYMGKLYYRVSDLSFVHSSGTMGKLSFPIKELNMDLYAKETNDLAMISSGTITAVVNIPIIMPNRRIVSTFKVVKSTPIL